MARLIFTSALALVALAGRHRHPLQRQGECLLRVQQFTIRSLAKLQLEPLRQELFHQEGPLEAATGGGFQGDGPAAERRIIRQAQAVMGGAQAVRQQTFLLQQLAIRLFHFQLHRHTRQQLAILPF